MKKNTAKKDNFNKGEVVIYKTPNELSENSTCVKIAQVAADGKI